MFCRQCGHDNGALARFCGHCGAALDRVVAARAAEAPDDLTEFYKAAIGPRHQAFYLRHFARFDAAGGGRIAWNWPALWMTVFWLLHRKMRWAALAYALLPFAVGVSAALMSGLLGALSQDGGHLAEAVSSLSALAYLVLPALYGNALYHRRCRSLIAQARRVSSDRAEQLRWLSAKGGTSRLFKVLLGVLLVFALVGALTAVALSHRQQRSSQAGLDGAVKLGEQAATAVSRFVLREGEWPADLQEAGFHARLPEGVAALDFDAETGLITVTLGEGAWQGKALLMVPQVQGDRVQFTCLSHEVAEEVLPVRCRPGL